ncbi:aldehyde dehydrogenase family-domain-containing protein [Armillaria nabsnona]|nr:aldehyde dehydrogenase family-domain-containing protein [Armillaria nabsnona]
MKTSITLWTSSLERGNSSFYESRPSPTVPVSLKGSFDIESHDTNKLLFCTALRNIKKIVSASEFDNRSHLGAGRLTDRKPNHVDNTQDDDDNGRRDGGLQLRRSNMLEYGAGLRSREGDAKTPYGSGTYEREGGIRIGFLASTPVLPAGVLYQVAVSREDSPAKIIVNSLVRKINFTGSDRVGRMIAIEVAKYLKPYVFELGGKAPATVLDDTDIDTAAKAIVSGALVYSGQVCMSTSRVLVQRGVSDTLTEKICGLCKPLKVGDLTAKITALFSQSSAENVLSMLREAIGEGAQVLVGDRTRDGSVIRMRSLALNRV